MQPNLFVFVSNYHLIYKLKINHIISLIRISKKQYYAQYFDEHQADIKKTWDGIRDLLNVSKKGSTKISKIVHENNIFTENSHISNTINDFFVNIGSLVDSKIPPSKKSFIEYLGDRPLEQLFIHECEQYEVAELIKNLSTSKASGPFSIPTNILK